MLAALLLLPVFSPGAEAQIFSNDEEQLTKMQERYPALKLANRTRIFVFQGSLDDFPRKNDARRRRSGCTLVLGKAKTVLVTTQAIPSGIQICLDSKPIFVVTPGDVTALSGDTLESAADKSAEALRRAVYESQTFTSARQVAEALGLVFLLTCLLIFVIWIARLIRVWIQIHITKLAAAKIVRR